MVWKTRNQHVAYPLNTSQFMIVSDLIIQAQYDSVEAEIHEEGQIMTTGGSVNQQRVRSGSHVHHHPTIQFVCLAGPRF
jgi:hypothetical protein